MSGARLAAVAWCCLAVSCGGAAESGAGSDKSDDIDPFVFRDLPADAYERIDALGVPAVGLTLTGRGQPWNTRAPNQFTLQLDVVSGLQVLHDAFADDLEALGYDVCSVPIIGVAPCIAQRAAGRLIVDIIFPDTLTIDVREPAGFPNGRRMEEPVGDMLLSMGFLDMGGDCPDGLCDLHTLALNPSHDDTPLRAEFPFLAPP